ncbi:ribosome biogenesis protein SLX9 homolog isoform X3 [Delphinus delphis]|uniref:ribosome biogenesis protein SLX9 homolog isoform X3 n=1 Tax=Delphinus delphis TaxID=9728 RepID=UPI0028C4CC8B|nr:ribosome biogenesis protein SLX9 homolog isoform X3 [Delphinus delphis]
MGKVRGLRSRVHKAAVRPTGEAVPGPTPPAREAASLQASAGGVGGKEWAFMNASVFAGTTIDPSALVQKLDVDARSSASVRRGAKAKAVLPKKEKLKLRRERWLQKIEATRLAEQERKAEQRRRATVVVGDLQPLRDALPELLELQMGGQRVPWCPSAVPGPHPGPHMACSHRVPSELLWAVTVSQTFLSFFF